MGKRNLLLTVFLVLVLPQLLFQLALKLGNSDEVEEITEPSESISTASAADYSEIYVKNQGVTMVMDLDEYITGVVLGEMPADFDPEALKAQAVAARTFALRSVQHGKHQDADVCTDAACCQACIFPSDYTGTASDLNKVRTAVMDTTKQVITYNGNLIEAVYFSSSGGQTEDALAVWGTDVPYLQSVDSPGEENATNYVVTTMLSYADFLEKMGLPDNAEFTNEDIVMTYTDSGGVQSFKLGNISYSGVQMRNLLNLRSTIFTIEIDAQNVRITTRGYGHRVGMSQYGAEAMAIEGNKYEEILQHYYSGTELLTLSQEQLDSIFDKTENI